MFNIARIIGPAIGGVLLKTAGTGFCFLFNAVSYIAVLAALLAMKVKPSGRIAATGHVIKNMAEGMRYVFNFAPIRNILFLLMVVSLSGASYSVLLPIFSSHVLHQGSGLYAMLFAAAGFGALAGAVFLALRESVHGLLRWIAVAPVIFGIGLVFLGMSRWIWLSVLAMPVIGFGLLVQAASSNTVIQTLVEAAFVRPYDCLHLPGILLYTCAASLTEENIRHHARRQDQKYCDHCARGPRQDNARGPTSASERIIPRQRGDERTVDGQLGY